MSNTPDHYNMEIQPIEYIMRNNLGFCEGNIVKYISRYKEKGGLSDLEKARHYLDLLIEQYEEIENTAKDYNIIDELAELEKKKQEKITANIIWRDVVANAANGIIYSGDLTLPIHAKRSVKVKPSAKNKAKQKVTKRESIKPDDEIEQLEDLKTHGFDPRKGKIEQQKFTGTVIIGRK
jgi:hypothetical protein